MEYHIIVDENGLITLKKNEEIVLITNYPSKLLDIFEEMLNNNGESELLKPKPVDSNIIRDMLS